jgi:hypothetical protein
LHRFDSRDAKFTEYRDWRNRNEGKVKTKSNLAAMQLQLQYLVLTIRAAEGVDREVIVPEVERFVTNIVANVKELGGAGMKTLRSPVNRTIFAEVYGLDRSLKDDNWNYSPGDYAAAFEKTIFPFVRETAPDQLAAAWDRRINLEKHHMELTQGGNQLAMKRFETERLPRLYWSKANDVFTSVSQQQGAAMMLRIVQTYGEHPDITKWVASFRGLLKAQPAPSPQAIPPPTPPKPVAPTTPVAREVDPDNPYGFDE